jgi:uncharacterized protein DUF6596
MPPPGSPGTRWRVLTVWSGFGRGGGLLLQLMPKEAEVRGLLALMLHCEARRRTRRGPNGRYIPLSERTHSSGLCH